MKFVIIPSGFHWPPSTLPPPGPPWELVSSTYLSSTYLSCTYLSSTYLSSTYLSCSYLPIYLVPICAANDYILNWMNLMTTAGPYKE